MNRALVISIAAAWCFVPILAGTEDESAATLGQSFRQGKFSVGMRYRIENVSEDAIAKETWASTLRTSLAYRTLPWKGFGLYAEFEDVSDLGLRDEHDNSAPGSLWNAVTDRPVIADPDLTEVNQIGFRLSAIPNTTIDVGRQAISIDNQRFIGPVAFRQNHQSFEAARVDFRSGDRLRLTWGFIDRVHAVNGAERPMSSHFLHGAWVIAGAGTLAAQAFLLDYDRASDAGLSSNTWGVQWRGSPALKGEWQLPYHVEWAEQSDAADNPAEFDASYARVEVGVKNKNWSAGGGYELLEGRAGEGRFTTPLATLHAFNGWADKFLSTPADGLQDLFVTAGYTRQAWTAALEAHDYSADSGSADYGSEIDLRLLWQSAWKQTIGLEVAFYDADEFSTDTEKLWLFTSWSF